MFKAFIGLGLALVCTVGSGCSGSNKGVPEVRVSRLQKADMSIRYVASGHVVSKTIRVGAPDTGPLVALPVQRNEAVKKGQFLFQIDDSQARQALDSIEAEIAAARTKVDENQALLLIRRNQSDLRIAQARHDREIAFLQERQKVTGPTAEERKKLAETVRQAQDKAALSGIDLQRQKQLFQEEIISQADLERAESVYRQDRSSLLQARVDYKTKTESRDEELAIQQAESAKAGEGVILAQQKADEDMLLAHRLRASQAEVERLLASAAKQRYFIARLRVTAPSDGVVSLLNYEQGEIVNGSSTVLSLVTPGPYYVEAEVDEQDAVHVLAGQVVSISLTSMPGKSYAGKVVEVAPSLEARPQGPSDHKVLRIKVNFTEKVGGLRSGLEADVQGQVGLAKEAMSLPRGALQRESGQDYVFTVKSGKLSRVDVVLGNVSGDRAEIRSGLEPDTEVVVEGGDGLVAGTAVRVLP